MENVHIYIYGSGESLTLLQKSLGWNVCLGRKRGRCGDVCTFVGICRIFVYPLVTLSSGKPARVQFDIIANWQIHSNHFISSVYLCICIHVSLYPCIPASLNPCILHIWWLRFCTFVCIVRRGWAFPAPKYD